MNVLIAFGTTEGQTRKIARAMARSIREVGHAATLYDCAERSAAPDVGEFDAVILAASVHHQRYQADVYDFVGANLETLKTKHTAFVSVSLSVTLASGEEEARRYVEDFAKETGLKPDTVHLAEGAVRYSEYGSSDELTVDLVVFKGQKTMPKRDGNPEYTDWQALEKFATTFVKSTTATK